ncbi:MAG: mechanosensitive ion channel family protein [Acidobacteria bacterium]|jgi:small-conductance mechanosensitive channel|nr:mechanosensitive ion channel family protein [Acidobacteriota bacterium]
MNWLIALPGLFLLLGMALFFAGRRRHRGGLFRQVLPQLLLLFLASLAIALCNSGWLSRLAYSRRLLFLLWLFFWFLLVVLAVKVLAYFVFDFLVLGKQGVHYPKLIKDVVVFMLFVVGVLLILKYYLNIPLTGVLASTAVLTVVIGFALQDILGNLFSGIILNFEDSFKIGDWLRIGEREGRVEQFGWRSFKVRTIDRELIVIPNQSASKAEVMIYGAGRQPVALKIRFGAGYGDSPDRVAAAVLQAMAGMPDVRPEPAPVVQLVDFGDFAMNYLVKFWVDDFSRHNLITSDARRRIWYAFRRQGIEIPFPKRDVYLKREKGGEVAREALASALKRNDVLAAVEDGDFHALLAAVETRVFGSGETVIREGDEGAHFFHVFSGAVNVLKNGQVIARLGPGDFFGEISLVTGERVNATVAAAEESVLILVSSARFKQVVEVNESMAMKLSAVITRRQDEMRAFSENNPKDDPIARKKESETLFRRILKYFASKE